MQKSSEDQRACPYFDEVWSRLERSFGLEGDPLTEQMYLTPLASTHFRSVTDALALARLRRYDERQGKP